MEPITDHEVQTFRERGWLVLPGMLGGDELTAMRADMDGLAGRARRGLEDFLFGSGHLDGAEVLRRIQYVVDKSPAARAMMGHPGVLRAVEAIAGPDLFPTQDAMVLKLPGQGIAVPWHRDRASTDDYPSEPPVFIADFYLDDADRDTCIWVITGSHRWSDAYTGDAIARLNRDGFSTEGAQPVLLNAGDVLLHNVRLLHGSPPNESSKLRRVVYYTFHTVHVEWEHGPYTREYVAAKQKVLRACIRKRRQVPYAAGETPFEYRPPAEQDKGRLAEGERLATYRYAAADYQLAS
jgi:ectoine hydroxylase-related dioxygenase (phytanoyl-CoA dioxygenase family)